MDFNKIIQMIINTLLRRAVNGAVNGAVNKGIGLASRVGKPAAPERAPLTDEEVAEHQRQAELRRARQASKRQL
jgi:hypothetical protein